MPTVNSREIVDTIIAGNGHYDIDPLVVRIVEYDNQFNGGIAYGLIYEGQDINIYHNSAVCFNSWTIFDLES